MLRRPETKKVATFLYELLVANAPSKDYAKRIAEQMSVPYPSLARYWQGGAVFPAGLVRSLFLATNCDRRIAEFFLLEGTGYGLEHVETEERDTDMARAVMHLNTLEGEISRLYLRATHETSESGEKISFSEARSLEEALRRLTTMAEELRLLIKKRFLSDR